MERKHKKCKCRNCHEFFLPDYRNVGRQEFCSQPECRKASKAESQSRWLNKPENKDYFRGPTNVQRVQQWREKNPEYDQKKKPADAHPEPLQDSCRKNDILFQPVKAENVVENSNCQTDPKPLQDSCILQDLVIIGLIAQFTGQTLQDDIYATALRLRQLGHDIFYGTDQQRKGEIYGSQTSCLPSTYSQNSGTVQLGGPPPGP